MAIIDLAIAHWDSLILILLACIVLVGLYLMGQEKIVYRILYSLVTEAERRYGSGTGELKQAYVMKEVYNALPAALKIFVSADQLGAWVDDALDLAKEKWAKNANISGYIEGGESK